MDGARLFNAITEAKVSAAEYVASCDTVTVCLSKGLCAPAGSVLAGPSDWIARARRQRKMVGGGMRQTGVLAAAGIIALRDMSGRLQEDHENAKRLAAGLRDIPGLRVLSQATNFLFVLLEKDAKVSQGSPPFPHSFVCNELQWSMIAQKSLLLV